MLITFRLFLLLFSVWFFLYREDWRKCDFLFLFLWLFSILCSLNQRLLWFTEVNCWVHAVLEICLQRAVEKVAARTLTVMKLTVVLEIDVILLKERRALAAQPVLAVLVIWSIFNVSIKERNQLTIVYRNLSVAFIQLAANDNNLIEWNG